MYLATRGALKPSLSTSGGVERWASMSKQIKTMCINAYTCEVGDVEILSSASLGSLGAQAVKRAIEGTCQTKVSILRLIWPPRTLQIEAVPLNYTLAASDPKS